MKNNDLKFQDITIVFMQELSPFKDNYVYILLLMIVLSIVVYLFFGENYSGILPFSKIMETGVFSKIINDFLTIFNILTVVAMLFRYMFKTLSYRTSQLMKKYTLLCREKLPLYQHHTPSRIKTEMFVFQAFLCSAILFWFWILIFHDERKSLLYELFNSHFILVLLFMSFMHYAVYYLTLMNIVFWEQRKYVM
ncbi:hypothetical protein [Moraxella lacunata]|nr:hypothetical protein [Moraxella lacunata]